MKRLSRLNKTSLILIIVVIVLVAIGAIVWSLMRSFEQPIIVSATNSLTVPENGRMDISSKLEVYNPNGYDLQLDSIEFELFLDGESYLTGNKDEPIYLPAKDTGRFVLPFNFRVEEFKRDLGKVDSALHKVEFRGYISGLKIKKIPIKLSYEKEMPLIKEFDASLKDVSIKDLNLKEPKLEARIALYNPNVETYDFSKVSYELKVDGEYWMKGELPYDLTLGPKRDTIILVPFTLKLKELSNAGLDYITSGDARKYTMMIDFMVRSRKPKFPDTRVQINKSDTLHLLGKHKKD